MVEEVLGRAYNEISPEEFIALSEIFAGFVNDNNCAYLQRFLLLMVNEVGTVEHRNSFVIRNNPTQYKEWVFDSNKMSALVRGLGLLTADVNIMSQLAYDAPESELEERTRIDLIYALSIRYRSYIQSVAILNFITQTQEQSVFRGSTNSSNPTFVISSRDDAFDITFSNNTRQVPIMGPQMQQMGTSFHHLSQTTMTISNATFGTSTTGAISENAGAFFGINETFNFNEATFNEIFSSLLGEALPTGLIFIPANIMNEYIEHTQLRNDMREFSTAIDLSLIATNFDMYSVIISSPVSSEQQILLFPSYQSERSLRNLNSLLPEEQSPITWRDIYENPDFVLQVIRDTGFDRLGGVFR